MDKIDCETAIARIKVFINRYFEKMGRSGWEESDNSRISLIDDIDEILDNTNIDRKRIVLESLELDKMKGGKENE